jgi:hypothetical protein
VYLALAGAVIVAVAVGIGVFLLMRDDGPSEPSVSFPAEWNADVEPLARFVETETGASFTNPVHVDFLSEGDFAERAEEISREPGNAVDPLLALPTSTQRALGLVQGEADLAGAAQQLEASRLALYSTSTQRIAVKGEELDTATKAALVHALTLAIDQQRFGLETDFDSDEAAWAYGALRAGDAARVSDAYLAALDPSERTGIQDPYAAEVAGATEVVRVLARAPSLLGEQLVRALLAAGGNELLAESFAEPPFSQEHLFDGAAFVDGDDPKSVDTPELNPGETEGATGSLGVLSWLVVLGEHTAPDAALQAADGWGGDAYVRYTADQGECIRAGWIGDEGSDVGEMDSAAASWTTAMQPGFSQFANENGVITVSACDPGSTATISTGTVAEAFAFVTMRAEVFEQALQEDPTVDRAWCIAERAAAAATLEEAQDRELVGSPEFAGKLTQYGQECA